MQKSIIKDLKYNKDRFRFEFQAPDYFRRINGNAIRQHLDDFSNQLINQLTEPEKSSLEASRCKGNKDFFGFVGRLLMTDLQLIDMLYLMNNQQEYQMPLDLLDTYMDVPLSVHYKILDILSKNMYITIVNVADGNMTLKGLKLVFSNEEPEYEEMMVPGNPRINAYIIRREHQALEPEVESKSLF